MGLVVLGVLLIVASAAATTVSTVVHDRLLRASLYDDALDREHVFQRIYSEVLTDPSVRDVTNNLLGDLDIGGRSVADTTALSNAVTRLALPPATLRSAAHQLIVAVLSYLRGDTARLDASVDLSAILQLDATVRTALTGVLQEASTRIIRDLPTYEDAVRDFATDLADGRVPASIPIIGGNDVSDDEIIAAIESAGRFGLPRTVVNQIVAAVRSGDERDALITASTQFVRGHVQTLLSNIETGSELRIDLVDALGRRAGQPQQDLIAQLNSVRRAAAWFPPWIPWLSLVGAVGGVAAIAGSLRSRRRMFVVLSLTSGASALVLWGGSRIVGMALRSPLERAATSGVGNTLPASVVRILGDVDRSIVSDILATVDRRAIWLLMVGAGCAAVVVAAGVTAWARRAGWRAVTAASVLAAAAVAVALPAIATARTKPDTRQCNGHAELCGRAYDDVVQAATHNSMSSPDVVQIWPEHDGNIEAQLDYGVRALLIDTHYWTAIDTPAELSSVEQAVPADIAAYLYRTLDTRLAAHPGTYLCHSRCAYGAVPFASALVTVKQFLDSNPNEVVTLVIQDEISVDDTAEAFAASGVAPYLYDGDSADGWPTLGAMIDSGQRLVVFAEAGGPPPAWYHSYADLVQDTGYHVGSIAQFSCALERGTSDAPLFMLNNWIQREAPDRADAAIVNRRAFIVERARRCAAERNRLPNFVAVNFFGIGDVIGAVDELNGVGN